MKIYSKAAINGLNSFMANAGNAAKNLIQAGFDVNALRPWMEIDEYGRDDGSYINVNGVAVPTVNALLQKDEWKALDTAVIQVARQRLNGIADLQNRGLVRNLGGLGVLTDEWESVSDMSDANVDMSGVTPGEEDSVTFGTQGVPIPITHKDFRINIRRLEASRRAGSSIDVVQAATASRKVRDSLESMLFNGITMKSDGYSVWGYTTFPQRIRTNISTPWDVATTSILNDVEHMLGEAHAAYHFGPFILYVPTNYWTILQGDYSANKDGTWLDRLRRYVEIEDVKPADVMNSYEIVMVEMSSDVVDLAVGQDISNVEWDTMGGMVQRFKVMAAMAPRLKYDGNGNTGIVHAFEAGTSTTTTA